MSTVASQFLPAPSSALREIIDLAPVARRAEVARLLALGALRALWRDVARPVPPEAPSHVEVPPRPREIALAGIAESSPCVATREHRAPPGAGSRRARPEDN